MMMNKVISTRPLISSSAYRISRHGRASFPVKPNYSVYAQFKHINGVPSRDSGSQVSINKLRMLDNLIERLARLKNKNNTSRTAETVTLNTDNIDPVIENLKKELTS